MKWPYVEELQVYSHRHFGKLREFVDVHGALSDFLATLFLLVFELLRTWASARVASGSARGGWH